MAFKETTCSENWDGLPPQNYRFFCIPPATTVDNRCLELQEAIEKQEKYIAELEEYILHAKEPIEHDIETHKSYKKTVKSALEKVNTQHCARYKAHQDRLQKTEDRLIELNQTLNTICKQIEDYKTSLPQQKKLLKQLQAELVKTVIEPVTQEIEQHFRLPPRAA